ncbi:MAG: ABC transporter permease, partial [Gemmatimonadaceae bacterium]
MAGDVNSALGTRHSALAAPMLSDPTAPRRTTFQPRGLMLQDLRSALRTLAKSPGFTAVVVLTLALGIGVNTAVFSVVNAALLRPLPVERPEELVRVFTSESSPPGAPQRRYGATSYPDYLDLRARTDAFAGMVTYIPITLSLISGDAVGETRTGGLAVSANYFAVLGVRPALGRAFAADEEVAGAASTVAVISDALWRTRFGGDRGVIGRTVTLAKQPFVIIGVAPAGFVGTVIGPATEIWFPIGAHPLVQPGRDWLRERNARFLPVLARLAPGATLARAQGSLDAAARELSETYAASSSGRAFTAAPSGTMLDAAMREQGPVMGIAATLMTLVALVLLVACANIANMLLARASRHPERV